MSVAGQDVKVPPPKGRRRPPRTPKGRTPRRVVRIKVGRSPIDAAAVSGGHYNSG